MRLCAQKPLCTHNLKRLEGARPSSGSPQARRRASDRPRSRPGGRRCARQVAKIYGELASQEGILTKRDWLSLFRYVEVRARKARKGHMPPPSPPLPPRLPHFQWRRLPPL